MYNDLSQQQLDVQTQLNAYISKVFGIMFLGLFVTAITAVYTATSETLLNLIFSNRITFIVLIGIEFALVVSMSARITKIKYGTALLLFFVYSVVNGVTLSSIFIVYDLGIIGLSFAVAAISFGVMAVYGMVTKADLTKIGSLLIMVLIGGIVATLINLFIKSSQFDLIISFVMVLVFVGLVAYDTQKLKHYFYNTQDNIEMQRKIGVLGALSLYLDFINIFLYVLRILGGRRRG